MKYFLPNSPSVVASAIVDKRLIDGSKGDSLAVWTPDEQGRLRTRLRHELMRTGDEVNEIPAPNGGVVSVLPVRLADAQIWNGITSDSSITRSRVFDERDHQGLEKAGSAFYRQSGFEKKADPENLGRNRFGFVVTDRAFGRTAERVGRERQVFSEWGYHNGELNGRRSPDMFYRAVDDASLLSNARSIIARMDQGETFNDKKITALSEVLSTPNYRVSDNALMEVLEAQVTRSVVSGELNTRQAIENVMLAFPRSRERSSNTISLQQYSTPFPFGDAASTMFGGLDGKRVLDPTVGNGALVASLAAGGAEITGIELDHGRMLRSSFALGENADIRQGAFDDVKDNLGEFDLVFVNPPFGQLDRKVEISDRGAVFPTKALHYQIAVEAVQKLKTGGDAFIVLPADIYDPEESSVAAGRFANWLRLGFDQVEEAVCDSRLYRGMGADVPVQIFAARGFREELRPFSELKALKEAATHRMLSSYENLYDWSGAVADKFASATIEAPETGRTAPEDPVSAPEGASGGRQGPETGGTPSSGSGGATGYPERPRKTNDGPSTPDQGTDDPREAQGDPEPDPNDNGIDGIEDVGIHASGQNITDDIAPLWLTEGTISDDTQRYQPFSAVGSSNTVIPKSLSGATYNALRQLEESFGTDDDGRKITIDDYVAGLLGITVDELEESQILSPEQIDAIALLHDAGERGKGALVGDLMGVGKGRTLAALAEAKLQSGGPVMFTTITPSLFTDFVMRDLQDVSRLSSEDRMAGGEINVHLVNSGAVLQDHRSGKTVYKQPPNKKDSNGAFHIEPDVNLLATSYSQFQTRDGGARLDAIKEWVDHHIANGHAPTVLLDESHNAASPSSNTGEVFQELIRYVEDRGGQVVRSSATGIKTGEHIELYYSCLPDTGLGKMELLNVMKSSGDLSLQEALAHEMAANGSMIVRQLSSAGVGRELPRLVDFDRDKIVGIRSKVDQATSILRDIIEQMPIITAAAGAMAEDQLGGEVNARSAKEKIRLDTNSPVSNLHHFSGYLTLGVKGQFLDDLITDSIARGEKPVVVVEHVGTSVLDWKLSQPNTVKTDDVGSYLEEPPHLGDVLKRYVEKSLTVKATNALGAGMSIDLSDYFGAWKNEVYAEIDAADFTAFRIDGADLVKAACADLDMSCGEITGRTKNKGKQGVGASENGKYYLYEIEGSTDSAVNQETARQFNDGDVDALVINRSASTGISLHASPANGDDCRRRGMIKLEIQGDIVQERQIDGRVDRNGQVEPPRYSTPLTGLASDDRLASLFNRKNRSLSASTNATRENDKTIEEVVDLLNDVGQAMVMVYLKENPFLAETLAIDVSEASSAGSVTRKLMGRLIALPLEEQQSVLGEIDVSYRMRLEYLDARGLNPLKNNKYDWKGKVISDEVILHENRVDGIASEPVKLSVVEAPVVVEPMSFEGAMKQAGRGLAGRMSMTAGTQPVDRLKSAFDDVTSSSYANPNFQSVPFQKALKRMDKKLFEGGAGLNIEDRTAELQAFFSHNRTPFAKLTEPKEIAFYELIENAQALRAFAKNTFIGGAIGVNVDLVPELADTRLAKALSSADLAPIVPAIVTDCYSSSAYPLDPDYWSVNVVVLGEREAKTLPLGNVMRSVRELGRDPAQWAKQNPFYDFDNFVSIARHTGSDSVISDWLVPDAKSAGLFSEYAATQSKARSDGTLQELLSKKGPLADRDDHRQLVKDMFDRTIAGTVVEQKHVMTGNMFRAIVLAQEGDKKSSGSKIMFSTDDGNWHHGIEIETKGKGAEVEKIRDKGRIAAISSPTIADAPSISALTKLVLAKHTYSGANNIGNDAALVDAIYDSVGDRALSAHVKDHGFQPFSEGIKPVSSIFIGPDVFSTALLQPMRKDQKAYAGLNRQAGIHTDVASNREWTDSLFDGYHTSTNAVKSAVGAVQRDFKKGELYYFTAGTSSCLVMNPKNKFLKENFPDLLEVATNKQLKIDTNEYPIRGGMVAIGIDWRYGGNESLHERICEAIADFGRASDQLPLLSGAFRDLTENLDRFSLSLQRDLALSQDVQSDLTKSNERVRNPETPSFTGASL